MLFIVDNHKFRRLIYEVLDHDPTHEDITRFLRRFRKELDNRDLRLKGVTTDGSQLYPTPLEEVFGQIPHQVCEFHVLKEIIREILKAVAAARRELKSQQPKVKRGRPGSKEARKDARKKKRLQERIGELFAHRHLFIKRSLTPKEKRILRRITRGLPALRVLRSIVEQVYRLFDRRCRTETALEKLAKLRQRVARFKMLVQTLKKLFTSNIEKALTFLDDRLLPSTSNAVERANRRYRKAQKSIYRVRTQEHIRQRIAVDMQREAQREGRLRITIILHAQRNGI